MAPARVEEDELIGEYDVFITPKLEEQLYLLQFPTRAREYPYNNEQGAKPLEMRMKPNTRFVELDIPIPTTVNYNKEKAQEWGEALNRAQTEAPHGFGITSGFNRGPEFRSATYKNSKAAKRDDEMDVDEEEDGFQMKHQILGGQMLNPDKGAPRYMIGTFQGKQLHLTALDGVAQMRQQYAHIDAKALIERNRTRREREAVEGTRTVEPKQVQQSYKPLESEHLDTNQTKELLQAAQEEGWMRYKYNDEELDQSYQLYHEKLFVKKTDTAADLTSSLDNEQYLDAISAPRKDPTGRSRVKPLTKKQRVVVETVDSGDDATDEGHTVQ